jgi:hypothetical protein
MATLSVISDLGIGLETEPWGNRPVVRRENDGEKIKHWSGVELAKEIHLLAG